MRNVNDGVLPGDSICASTAESTHERLGGHFRSCSEDRGTWVMRLAAMYHMLSCHALKLPVADSMICSCSLSYSAEPLEV